MLIMVTVIAIVTLTSAAANFVHWRLLGHRFLYWPTGPVGVLVNLLLVAQLVLSVLMLAGIVSPLWFWLVLGSPATIAALYSIRRRQQISLGATAAA
jgi:hypothetical protein